MEVRLGRTLSPQELENKLRGFRPYLKDVGWSEAAQLEGVFFDISRVEYADFGALAQVALLVECAVRYKIELKVALPLPRRREGEQGYIESFGADIALQRRVARSIDARVQRRGEALRFARNSGFIESVRCAHVPLADGRVVILTDFDRNDSHEYVGPAAPGEARELESEHIEPAALPRSVVPLQWLTPDIDTRDWERRIRRVLTLRGAGLAPGDAEAATTIVLRELIDNVRAHANEGEKSAHAPAALVGAIVFRRRTAMGTPVGDRTVSEPYGEWIRKTGAAVVRIVVGDSGAGIHTTLREHVSATAGIDLPEFDRPLTTTEQTLMASLSPWSSRHRGSDSRKGGVRGLASVRRVVREANGALLLRCADTVSGMTYPEGARLPVSQTRLAWIPGTLIDLSLAPAAWSPPTASLARGSVQVRGHIGLVLDGEGELQAASVLQAVARRPGPGMWILSGQVPDTPEATYGYCSDVLHLAEELSDENAIVLHAGHQTSTELVPRLRAFDDTRTQRRETAGVVVMVMDERGESAWMGVNRRQSRLLSVLQAQGFMSIGDLSDQLGLALPALQEELRPLRQWIVESPEGVRLSPTPAELLEGLGTWLADEISSREDVCVTQRAKPGAVLVTPSLSSVSLDPRQG